MEKHSFIMIAKGGKACWWGNMGGRVAIISLLKELMCNIYYYSLA